MTTTLAMFPLGTALLPYGLLPLHVFEDRYRAMVRDVLGGSRQFGVVLIERGSEVGGGDVRTDVGTVATVLRASELLDGRWQLVAAGTPRRFRVVEWLADDPYPRADVEEFVDTPVRDAGECRTLLGEVVPRLRRLQAMRAEAGAASAPIDIELDGDDVALASWHAALLTGMGPLDAQGLLSIDDPAERLRRISTVVEEQLDTLTFQLRGDRE